MASSSNAVKSSSSGGLSASAAEDVFAAYGQAFLHSDEKFFTDVSRE